MSYKHSGKKLVILEKLLISGVGVDHFKGAKNTETAD